MILELCGVDDDMIVIRGLYNQPEWQTWLISSLSIVRFNQHYYWHTMWTPDSRDWKSKHLKRRFTLWGQCDEASRQSVNEDFELTTLSIKRVGGKILVAVDVDGKWIVAVFVQPVFRSLKLLHKVKIVDLIDGWVSSPLHQIIISYIWLHLQIVFWPQHLQMGPTKVFWGPLKFSICLPPPP